MKKILLSILIFFAVLEIGSMLICHTSDLYDPPGFVWNTGPKSLDRNEMFGVWHPSNSTYRHNSACFAVTNDYNSYGARDIERKANGDNRFFIIGDSYIEGYGIEEKERVGEILEKRTGKEFLNFATSGSFGSTQMLMCYKYFQNEFEHDALLIGLFPTNDFYDDNLEYGQYYMKHRYRPYHVKAEGDSTYSLVYYQENIEDSAWAVEKRADFKKIFFESLLPNFSHFATILRQYKINKKVKHKTNPDTEGGQKFKRPRFAHADFSEDELELLLYNLSQFKSQAGGREVFVFTIPAKWELYKYHDGSEVNRLSDILKDTLPTLGIEFIDVTGEFLNKFKVTEYADLYLECDGHWSAKGNEACADIIETFLAAHYSNKIHADL